MLDFSSSVDEPRLSGVVAAEGEDMADVEQSSKEMESCHGEVANGRADLENRRVSALL